MVILQRPSGRDAECHLPRRLFYTCSPPEPGRSVLCSGSSLAVFDVRFDPPSHAPRSQTCANAPCRTTAQILTPKALLSTPHNLQYHFCLGISRHLGPWPFYLPSSLPPLPIAISYFLPEFVKAGLNVGSESLAVHLNLAKSRQRAGEK